MCKFSKIIRRCPFINDVIEKSMNGRHIVCLLCYSYRVSRKVGVLTQPQRGGHLSLCVSPKLVNQGALEYITHGCRLLTIANELIPTSMCGLSYF